MRKVSEMLLRELGEENIDQMLDEWFPDGETWEFPKREGGEEDGDDPLAVSNNMVAESISQLKEAARYVDQQGNHKTG
ncbi:hypothetical protein [Geomicrobium sp. JCM 19039]|uniref:hypothetical protein n=1 Tax=Geomicrobium sp. JCM 19039 TaxID=1460636 RepID=UPI0012690A86|nr:hypothetical protein [Geomicrobium sp. JCM 19039]